MVISQRSRLAEQFARVSDDAGRYEDVERERFISSLLQRIEEHQRETGQGHPRSPMSASRAARQGHEVSALFSFIMDDLRARTGNAGLARHLTRCGSPLALSLSRRLATPSSSSSLRLAAVRVAGTGVVHEVNLHSSMVDNIECARADITIESSNMYAAIAVENAGISSSHACGIELRVQAESASEGLLQPTSICIFGVIPEIAPGRRTWLALHGIDLAGEAARDLGGEQPSAMRFLLCRK